MFGVSAATGSWPRYETTVFLYSRISRGEAESTSWPATLIDPAVWVRPGRKCPRSPRASVVFPEPDSPTTPSRSPCDIDSDTSLEHSPAAPVLHAKSLDVNKLAVLDRCHRANLSAMDWRAMLAEIDISAIISAGRANAQIFRPAPSTFSRIITAQFVSGV